MAAEFVRHAAYTRLAFADDLKAALLRVNPLIDSCCCYEDYRLADALEDHGGWEGAKEVPEVRRLLQAFGQAVRDQDPDVWVRPAQARVRKGTEWNLPCIVTDVRYANELAALREEGAVAVRVERPGAGLTGAAGDHASETELDGVAPDHVLRNNGTPTDLRNSVRELLTQLGD
ncbi:deoxynucleotide monophosphate kinase family protein [Streptomyces sp. NPDC002067]